jgi:hypothetical protein
MCWKNPRARLMLGLFGLLVRDLSGWVWLAGCGWLGVAGWVWLAGCGRLGVVGTPADGGGNP